ncbi:MAG: hypothetical protein J6T12_01875 [Salinivirgaceae bacterium]|nr:hypothetical protein [Salinivirgaceae bacterium]
MYRGFKIEDIDNIIDVSYYYQSGLTVFNKYETKVKNALDYYIIGNGIIDGTAIQNHWFPQVDDCNVFISHSHQDRHLAIALAGWLEETFGLTSFVDSCIWGYANELLKDIDNNYCRNVNSRTYNYNRRNYSTSHVHMMLNMALMQMIDKTECLFFLNTPNSICLDDIETCTLSPWIYSEIGISQMIKKNPPKRRGRKTFSKIEKAKINDSVDFKYNLDLSHLKCIDDAIFNRWAESDLRGGDALDALYEIVDGKLAGTKADRRYIWW